MTCLIVASKYTFLFIINVCFQDISEILFETSATVPLQMCSFELWSLCIQHTLLCDLYVP